MGAAVSKRGLAANDDLNLSGFGGTYDGLSTQITWQYNWDSTTTNKQSYTNEFVPMLWGTASDHTDQWATNVNYWYAQGTTHLLAFNEPEQTGQANLSPSDAVTAFREWMTPYDFFTDGDIILGAPAVSNDGYDWIVEFLDLCEEASCGVSFVPIHWYNPYTDFEDFENWVTSICDLGYPVWVTEFEGIGTNDEQSAFLAQAIPWLDSNSCVERYSYFGVADNDESFLDNGGPALTALGYQYAFSPFPSTCGELTC
ncbi:hypothetical protein BX600DRAFT_461876 [Xylariales sp. PMI_506]|nr:hypothetical protein BX600DRAFT_461876 [Xylariales sp. PMI_506]